MSRKDGILLTSEQRDYLCRIAGWRSKTYRTAIRESDGDPVTVALPIPMSIEFGEHVYSEAEGESDWYSCGDVKVIIDSVKIDDGDAGGDCIVAKGVRGHKDGKRVTIKFPADDNRGIMTTAS